MIEALAAIAIVCIAILAVGVVARILCWMIER